jgi:hypothetical protein
MKKNFNLFILSASLLTAELFNLSNCCAAEVLLAEASETSSYNALEALGINGDDFKQFYNYQASRCSELQELIMIGDHNHRIQNIFNNRSTHITRMDNLNIIYCQLLVAYIREANKWVYQGGGLIDQEFEVADDYNCRASRAPEYREEFFIPHPMPIFTLFEKLAPITQNILNYVENYQG